MPLFYHMERFRAPHKVRMSLFFYIKIEDVHNIRKNIL